MSAPLADVFASPSTARPSVDEDARSNRSRIVQTDPEVIEAQYQQLNERRAAATRATIARRDAATARAVAQAFSEYGRAFRKVATTKGSPVDHAVALNLATYCETQVEEYAALQAHCSTVADRAGSL